MRRLPVAVAKPARWTGIWMLVVFTALWHRVGAAQSPSPVVELRGGQWFEGRRFVSGSRWMRGDRFIARPGVPADSIVDLRGRWMVPPFGDAHTHSPDGPYGFEGVRDMYLRLGVFYVQTLANSRSGRLAVGDKVNMPSSVDVAFADGAVTGTGGHPQILYEALGLYRRFAVNDAERFAAARSLQRDGDVYHRLDSLPQLAPILRRLSRDTLPILKVMLLESERWNTRHADTTQWGYFGMNPALLPPLVDAAHRMGRRVWAHIETPTDLAIALKAGVDGFAHVPGYGAAGATDSAALALRIPDSTVRLAGARHVVMTPTLALAARSAGDDTAKVRRFMDVTVYNARILRKAGVQLLAGSDTYSNGEIVASDPATTARLLGLSPLEFLRLWAVDTPTAIFPARKIARLSPDYEASMLVLTCNPLRATGCVSSIGLRLKQGTWLTVAPPPKE